MHRTSSSNVRIAAALVWEFCTLGWLGIVLAPLGALVLPSLILGMLTWEYRAPIRDQEVGNLLRSSFYWISVLFLGMPVFVALGNPARRYALPASSLVLVAVPMCCAMATIFVEYALVAMFLNTCFDAGWPILGPGLLACILIAWCQAVLWWHTVLGMVSFLPLLLAIKLWGPEGSLTAQFGDVNGWHIFSFGVAAIVCVVVGAFGFSKRRHGSDIDIQRIIDWLGERFRHWTTARWAPFSSPTSAQFWLEWTERGYVLPLVVACLGFAVLCLAWFIPLDEQTDFVRGSSALVLTPLLVIGMFWGLRNPQGDFGSFNGTRPLSDGQIANAILKSSTLGLLASAAIWAALMVLVFFSVGDHAEASRVYQVIEQLGVDVVLARVALGAAALWCVVGFVTSLALAGKKAFLVGFVLTVGVALAGALLPLPLQRAARPAFTQAYFLVWLVVFLFVAVAVFIASWRRRLISPPALALAALIVVAALAAAQAGGLTRDWKYLLPVVCACGVLPFPLAAAPLATWINRHR